jgi:hypothetical protein
MPKPPPSNLFKPLSLLSLPSQSNLHPTPNFTNPQPAQQPVTPSAHTHTMPGGPAPSPVSSTLDLQFHYCVSLALAHQVFHGEKRRPIAYIKVHIFPLPPVRRRASSQSHLKRNLSSVLATSNRHPLLGPADSPPWCLDLLWKMRVEQETKDR